MAIPRSSIKKRGKVFYLRFSENGVHKRISLHTNSLQEAKEQQRQFDSARARGELDMFPTKTPLASAVAAYAAHMKATRTRQGEFFGEAQLKDFVCANSRLQPAELLESLRYRVVEFSGSEAFADDLTCVAVKITDTVREEPFLHAEQEASSELEELTPARAFLRRFCRDLPAPGIGEDDLNHLEIAVNEALANIIQHAYGGRSGQKIQIMADAYTDRICVRLYHWGEPLEDDTLSPPVPDGSQESGFGLYLIAQSVDEVRYSRDEGGRNCVSLVKHLPRNP